MKRFINILIMAIISLAAYGNGGFLTVSSAMISIDTVSNLKTVKMIKKCSKCELEKDVNEFYKDSVKKDGLRPDCKKCTSKKDKTKEGRIRQMYNGQRSHRKAKGLPMPEYNYDEFRDWVLGNTKYDEIHSNWVKSGYIKKLSPSVDRKDDHKGYSFDNIQLVTWGENFRKANKAIREGIIVTPNLWYGGIKSVIGTNNITGEVRSFISIAEASRELKLQTANICKVAKGQRKHTCNWSFKYKNNENIL